MRVFYKWENGQLVSVPVLPTPTPEEVLGLALAAVERAAARLQVEAACRSAEEESVQRAPRAGEEKRRARRKGRRAVVEECICEPEKPEDAERLAKEAGERLVKEAEDARLAAQREVLEREEARRLARAAEDARLAVKREAWEKSQAERRAKEEAKWAAAEEERVQKRRQVWLTDEERQEEEEARAEAKVAERSLAQRPRHTGVCACREGFMCPFCVEYGVDLLIARRREVEPDLKGAWVWEAARDLRELRGPLGASEDEDEVGSAAEEESAAERQADEVAQASEADQEREPSPDDLRALGATSWNTDRLLAAERGTPWLRVVRPQEIRVDDVFHDGGVQWTKVRGGWRRTRHGSSDGDRS